MIELKDRFSSGRKIPWKEKKKASYNLALYYRDLSVKYEKSENDFKRFRSRTFKALNCGNNLKFRADKDISEYESGIKYKLYEADFCRIRLCPMCIWRRSLKIYHSVQLIMDKLGDEYDYYLMTLTIRNVKCAYGEYGKNLKEAIKNLNKSFLQLLRRKVFKPVKGTYKCIEVTVNRDKKSEWYKSLHPHIHCIVAVEKGTVMPGIEEISKNWKRCAKLDYYPQTDIRLIKKTRKNINDIVSEVSKYCVKDDDLLIDAETVYSLDYGLEGLRLLSLSGCFKAAGRLLNIDPEDDNLVDTYSDIEDAPLEYVVNFVWRFGYMGYFAVQ